jgi:hypothetical protein
MPGSGVRVPHNPLAIFLGNLVADEANYIGVPALMIAESLSKVNYACMLVQPIPRPFFPSEIEFRVNAYESSTISFFTTAAVQLVVSDNFGTK